MCTRITNLPAIALSVKMSKQDVWVEDLLNIECIIILQQLMPQEHIRKYARKFLLTIRLNRTAAILD